MTPRLFAVAGALVLSAVGLILYKVLALGYEPWPQPAPDRWSVQIEIPLKLRADESEIAFFLPADGPTQRIYDERVDAAGMSFFIRPRGPNRIGMALGRPEDGVRLTYQFSVRTRPQPVDPLPEVIPAISEDERKHFSDLLASTPTIQSESEVVAALLEELAVDPSNRAAALRQIHEFLVKDVETTDGREGPQDAASVLRAERGGSLGKARAAVALLRAVGIPARVVAGVRLVDSGRGELVHWVEARLDGRFWPLDPLGGALGFLPEERLQLHVGDGPAVEARGAEAGYRISMLRERETQYQIYRRRVSNSDRLLDKLSLYSLPVQAQLVYRLLLLVPLGALVVAIFRNLIGVPTFGTFGPILLALALRETGILWGLLLLGVVVVFGWLGRQILDRARLLMVPRLSFLLTLVILIIAGVMVVAENLGLHRAVTTAAFPIVILTMTIERLAIAMQEEGPENTAKLVLGTLLVAITGYWVIANDQLQHFVFTFPEVHLVTLALLLVLGRYTGYRLSEWARFRAFHRDGLQRAG